MSLTPLPAARVLCVLGFADAIASAHCVPVVLRHAPLTMESINAELIGRLPGEISRAAIRAGLPEGTSWLLVEMGATDHESAVTAARAMLDGLRDSGSAATPPSPSLVIEPAAQAVLWRCRTDAAGLATRRADGAEAWGGWEDAAVPPEQLGRYLAALDELLARHGVSGASYGHFGEGCMHMRIDFDLLRPDGVAAYRSFVEQATDLVVGLGGSVSGEHGDGRARSELLGRMYGADGLALLARMKDIWDPERLMNPGVIVDPPALDEGIRHVGTAAQRTPLTLFAYPDDNDDFAQAQRRCVGIGKCRQSSGGVMCPSYQATREELHSTRGRAHLLWPDTFTNHLAPEVGRAAVEVLEAAGYRVTVPPRPVCCGLTWISTGQLHRAKKVLERSLTVLAPELAAGTSIVGLEPSCTAALRHDALALLPGHELAAAAAASVDTLAGLLSRSGWQPPRVGGDVLVQTHCHQHAVLGFDAERAVLAGAGVAAEVPDSGCCGLAGNFGFERGHYAVSQAVGERVLLPAVRAATPDTAIVADGFSCRTQISHGTDRRPVHLAELLAASLR